MSTDLYGVRILEVLPAAKTVKFQLIVTYYEPARRSHMPLLSDITGIFRVVADSSNSGYRKSPIADELTVEQYCSEKWVNENAYKFIVSFTIQEKLNTPLRSYKGISEFYYCRDGRWQDEEKLAQGIYAVTMTDAKYLAHLKKGQVWGTTAYDTHGLCHYRDEASPNIPDLLGAKTFKPDVYKTEGFDRAFVDSFRASIDGSFCYAVFSQSSETAQSIEVLKINWADGGLVERYGAMDMLSVNEHGLRVGELTFWFNYRNIVKIWDTPPPAFKHKFFVFNSGLWSAELRAKRFSVFNQKNSKVLQIERNRPLRGAAVSADDKCLALWDDGYEISFWDLEQRIEIFQVDMPCGDASPHRASFSPDGRYLAMISHDKFLRILDVERRVWVYHYRPVRRGEEPIEFAWGPKHFIMQTAVFSGDIEFNVFIANLG